MFCKGNPLPPLLVFNFFFKLTGINNNNELHIHVPLNYKVILIYTCIYITCIVLIFFFIKAPIMLCA